ncbi:MAG: hypothetical protein R3A46_09210 [Thermomicrobiales bacterium]
MEIVPLTPVEGRAQLEQILSGVATDLSLLGLLSVVGLIWSAKRDDGRAQKRAERGLGHDASPRPPYGASSWI